MLRNSRFDAEEIEREKGVIVEEMNMYFDTPRDFIGGVYEELLYGDQPLGRDIIGTQGDGPRRDARDVHGLPRTAGTSRRGWCSASRAAIGDGLLERAQELLGDLADEPTGEPEPVAPYANGRVRVFEKQSDQAHVVLGVHSLPLDHPDRYALSLLATALGGGMSSRLFSEVRERRGLAYYVYGLNHSYTDAGHALRAGGRRHHAHRRRRLDDRRRATQDRGRAAAAGRAREGAELREGPLRPLQLETPQGLMMFGLRREVLESGRSPTPTTCSRDSTQ